MGFAVCSTNRQTRGDAGTQSQCPRPRLPRSCVDGSNGCRKELVLAAAAPEESEKGAGSATQEDPAPSTGAERRVAPRYHFRVPVRLTWSGQSATAMVQDMSSSGARVEEASCDPPEGTRLHLEFSFFVGSASIPLGGEVVRTTETGGFAVRFTNVDARKSELLRVLLPKVASARLEHEEQVSTFSGQLVSNLGPRLHNACHDAARAEGLTLNEWIKAKLQGAATETLAHAGDSCDCADCRTQAARGTGSPLGG